MFKIISCIVIILSFAFAGFYYSNTLLKRKALLESFVCELKRCITVIRYNSFELSKMFENNFMEYEFNDKEPFSNQWCNMLERYKNILKSSDRQILTDFSKSIGTLDVTGEISNLELYIDLLNNQVNDAENEIVNKSKMYKTLGVSLGLAVAIMII